GRSSAAGHYCARCLNHSSQTYLLLRRATRMHKYVRGEHSILVLLSKDCRNRIQKGPSISLRELSKHLGRVHRNEHALTFGQHLTRGIPNLRLVVVLPPAHG